MYYKQKITATLALALVLSLSACGEPASDANAAAQAENNTQTSVFAAGSGTVEDPYQVATAEQLDAVHDHLNSHFVLTANIDLAETENWTPLGAFVPIGTSEEESETPTPEKAFTGTFDGGAYTISGLQINAAEENGVGLFGCVTGDGSAVTNLTVTGAKVIGGSYTGGIIGMVDTGVVLEQLNLYGSDVSGTFLVGGVAGASFADISNCSAESTITLLGDNAQGAGMVVGGLEGGSLDRCTAANGTVNAAGAGCYSVGALAGCAHTSASVQNCTADKVTVTVGAKGWLVGGLAGHAGTFEGDPTVIENCTVKDVSIVAGENTERIGGISGGGFYASTFAQYYPEPAAIAVKNCTVSTLNVTGGKLAGSVLGYAYSNCTVEGCTAEGTWNGTVFAEQIGADGSVPLSDLA